MSGYCGWIGAGTAFTCSPDPVPPLTGEERGPVSVRTSSVLPKPHGVVLDLSAGPEDVRVVLVDGNGRPLLSLGPFPEEDVVARWRSLALTSGAVPMLQAAPDRIEALAVQIGRLRVGSVTRRRRRGLVRRRPRFLLRRKGSRLPSRPLVYREREIAGGVNT